MSLTASDLLESFDFGDSVDVTTFQQILDMDEDDDDGSHEFSKSIVFGFFEQAETTFDSMDDALASKDLEKLSSLGHFLKGSSATLGYTLVKDQCEKIQNYGHQKDESGINDLEADKCLQLIREALVEAKDAFATVQEMMERFYAKL